MSSDTRFQSLQIAVLTVSDTRTVANDTSGDYLSEQLQQAGHRLIARNLIPDDLTQGVSQWIADPSVEIILTTGGTGLTGGMGHRSIGSLFDKTLRVSVNSSATSPGKLTHPPYNPGQLQEWQTGPIFSAFQFNRSLSTRLGKNSVFSVRRKSPPL